jgi:hypothetical protein
LSPWGGGLSGGRERNEIGSGMRGGGIEACIGLEGWVVFIEGFGTMGGSELFCRIGGGSWVGGGDRIVGLIEFNVEEARLSLSRVG